MGKTGFLGALAGVCLILCACSGNNNSNRIVSGSDITPMPSAKTTEATVTENAGYDGITAALISVDSDKQKIIVKDIYDGSNYVLSYNGGTDVTSLFDEVIRMEQLEEGEILKIEFDAEKKKAQKVTPDKEAFRTQRVTGFKATNATRTITFGSGSYKYPESIVVVSDGKTILPSEVMNRDEVTVRGYDDKIYSVTVDKGHGYLTFSGVEPFIGGMVEIGRSLLYTVSGDMVIAVPEGEYKVVLTNGDAEAKKTVYITRNMTVTMDFSEYVPPANKSGTVEFQILPKDAELFLEGNKIDYTRPVTLEYGTYIINILSEKYNTYTTRLIVDSTYQVKTYDLSKLAGETETSGSGSSQTTAPAQTSTATVTTAATTKETTSATTKANETTAATTGSVKVTISEPQGAGVYVNNQYVGTAPVTVNENPGEYVITFKREGYITKSYIVDVDSSDGEQTLSFPAMSEE